MLISLVGLSGSGKSYISKLLCSYSNHIIHLDIDKIGHNATNDPQVKEKLIKIFGPQIIENGIISRPVLGNIVFNSKEAMDILNELTWSYMEARIDEFIANHPNNIIILDWLLLPKTKYFKASDLRILIKAPIEVRIKRAIKRDGITKEKFLTRDNNAPKINENEFEYIIDNIDITKTKKEVEHIYDKSIIHRKF